MRSVITSVPLLFAFAVCPGNSFMFKVFLPYLLHSTVFL